jgi:hypothetical protein
MEKGTTKIIFWSATALILIGGGYYGYTLYAKSQKEKKEKEEQEKKEKEDENKKDTPKKDYVAPPKLPSTGFKTKAEGDAFRTYVIANYPEDAKKWDLDPSGNQDNDTIRKAYSFYGEIYKKALSTSVTIGATYQGNWDLAKSIGATTFIFEGKTYVTETGRAYLDSSLIAIGNEVFVVKSIPIDIRTFTGGVSTYRNSALTLEYSKGARDNGNFYPNQSVGRVKQKVGNALLIENTYAPVIFEGQTFTQFWIPSESVTKVKPSNVW